MYMWSGEGGPTTTQTKFYNTLFSNIPTGQWPILFPDKGLFPETITTQILLEHWTITHFIQ